MTITLAPQTEAKLKDMAVREGCDENTLAVALLAEVLEAAARDHEETISGLKKGRQAYAEGRSRPFSEYVVDVMERRRQRSAAHDREDERVAA